MSNAKSKQPKLTCRNWESGILWPVEMKIAVQMRSLEDKAAAGFYSQLGREYAKRAESVSNKASEDNTVRVDGNVSSTGVESIVVQVEVGKEEDAIRSGSSASGKGNASKKKKEEGVTDASMRQDAVKSQELPSLAQVFSEVVPVPLRYPAPSHIARQNIPWFFME